MTTKNVANPTLKAGKIIWKLIVKANCILESSSALIFNHVVKGFKSAAVVRSRSATQGATG